MIVLHFFNSMRNDGKDMDQCETSHKHVTSDMSQLDTMTSESILPGITPTTAIPAIYAKDSTVNVAGRNQIFNNVDPNRDRGI